MTTLLRSTLAVTVAVTVMTTSVLTGATTALAQPDHDHGSDAPHAGGAVAVRDYDALWRAASAAEREAATDLVDATRATVARWHDVDAALADGFFPRRGGVGPVHYPSFANRRDDGILDPQRPEALVYLQRPGGDPILLGVVYVVTRAQGRPTPTGDLAAWHVHGIPGCHHPDLDEGCADVQGGMLHVWVYDGVVDPFADPMFASMGTPQAWRSKLYDLAGVARRV